MSKNLQMSLKTKWFEMTKSGEKTEDYRELNEYWFKRLVFDYEKVFLYCTGVKFKAISKELREVYILKISINKNKMFGFVPFDSNIMTLGYPSKYDKERIILFEHAGIEIREGRPEWGAEPGKIYFVIKHGKKL